MVKVSQPLGSSTAQGSIAKKLTYYRRNNRQKCRQYASHPDTNSASQQTQRGYFQEAVEKWQSLNESQKEQWNAYVS